MPFSQKKPNSFKLSVLVLSFAAMVASCFGYSGDNDNTFSQRGIINGPIYAVVVDSRTNIWIGGDFTSVYGNPANYIAILNADGTFKSAPSWTGVQYPVHALALGNGDRVYAGSKFGVFRFTAGGALDNSYTANTSPRLSQVNSIAIRPIDDTLWVGSAFGITSLNSGGSTNDLNALPVNVRDGYVSQVKYVPPTATIGATTAEQILLAGSFGAVSMTAGGADCYFYQNGYPFIPTCIAQRNPVNLYACNSGHGEILAGGNLDAGIAYNYFYPSASALWLGRYGGSDSATYFPTISSSTNYPADQGYGISAIEALDGGDMLIGGEVSRIRGNYVGPLVHLLPDGSVDTAFNSNVGIYPYVIAKQPDGKFIVAGFSQYTPLYGQILRRNAMDAPRPVTFTAQPAPTNTTLYAGDSLGLSATVDAWPPPSVVWIRNGVELSNNISPYLSIYSLTTNDGGTYRLRAKTFCAGNVDSQSAHVTVLPQPPAPANDNFSNAIPVTGLSNSVAGTIRSATLEAGEVDGTGQANGASVWWTWTAPADGVVTLDLSGTDFQATLNVYSGSTVGSLNGVTNNCKQQCYSNGEGGTYCYCQGLMSSISFNAVKGTTYQFAVGGSAPAGGLGNILLSISENPPIPSLWKQTQLGLGTLYAAVYANGKFIVGGDSKLIGLSLDGTNWSKKSNPLGLSDTIYSFDYANGLFVGVATSAGIITSPDGVLWTKRTVPVSSGNSLYSVAHSTNGLLVAVGDAGTIVTSPDGITWTAQNSGLTNTDYLNSVTYFKGQFVASYNSASILTSVDGTNWSSQADVSLNYIGVLAAGRDKILGFGSSPTIVSTNAMNWTNSAPGVGIALNGGVYGGGYFMGVGDQGDVEITQDGNTFYKNKLGATANLQGAAYSVNGQFLAVGDNGTILLHQPLSIGVATFSGNSLILNITGMAGFNAILESAATPNSSVWQPLATNRLFNGFASYTNTVSLGTNSFFRVRLN